MKNKMTKIAIAVCLTTSMALGSAIAATDNTVSQSTANSAPSSQTATTNKDANAVQNTTVDTSTNTNNAENVNTNTNGNTSSNANENANTNVEHQNSSPNANNQNADNSQSTTQALTINKQSVVNFAQKAAIASFSYNYSTYQQDMQNMQQYFSKKGWQSFSKALDSSNNLNVVQKEKLTVSAVLNGTPSVLDHQQTATGQQWQVSVPLKVTYKNEKNQQIQQDLNVKMVISTVSTNINPNGIGINQFIAMPASKAETGKSSS